PLPGPADRAYRDASEGAKTRHGPRPRHPGGAGRPGPAPLPAPPDPLPRAARGDGVRLRPRSPGQGQPHPLSPGPDLVVAQGTIGSSTFLPPDRRTASWATSIRLWAVG